MCLLTCVLNCEQHFSYFDPDYPTSGLTVTGLARVYCVSVFHQQLIKFGNTVEVFVRYEDYC
jgi:hypothetical protein